MDLSKLVKPQQKPKGYWEKRVKKLQDQLDTKRDYEVRYRQLLSRLKEYEERYGTLPK